LPSYKGNKIKQSNSKGYNNDYCMSILKRLGSTVGNIACDIITLAFLDVNESEIRVAKEWENKGGDL